jgi:hypothetical protein
MSILVNSRINFLWQLLMPVNYVSGLAIYLGLTEIFVVWWAFRAWLNFLTHTEIRWDLPYPSGVRQYRIAAEAAGLKIKFIALSLVKKIWVLEAWVWIVVKTLAC